ncbi:MAG: amino acid adenylation domain-containing protein, partial [Thermoanaerobaculia bacterium]
MEGYPLSPQQKQLWRLGAGEPQTPFRTQCVVALQGDCDPRRLWSALRRLVARHEILRTCFRRPPELVLPLQVIAEDLDPAAGEIDLSALAPLLQEELVAAAAAAQWQRTLLIERGPLVHAVLIRCGPASRRLILTFSALCLDAPSLRRLFVELVELYGPAPRGAPDEPEKEPLQYADVADWLNELLASEEMAAAREYWQQHGLEARRLIALPWEVQRAENGSYEPRRLEMVLPEPELRALEDLAGDGALAEVVLALWRVLLWRLTDDPGVPVGAALDGRKYAELEDALGPLWRFLPLPGELHPGMTTAEVAAATRQGLDELHRWQEYFSWDQISSRDQDGARFLPFLFDWADAAQPLTAGEVTFTLLAERACGDRSKAALHCRRRGDRLELGLSYDAAVLAAGDAERLLAQLRRLAADAGRRPQTPVAALNLLGESERERLLVELNRTHREHADGDRLLHSQLERQAEETPEATAVVFESAALSYAELERRANQLARYLKGRGVGPDVRVAILAERSLEMVVAFFGVLKAGGAYVPIDPDDPPPRIALMLEDSRPAVVLVHGAVDDRLPAAAGEILRLDEEWPRIAAEAHVRPACAATSDHLAYVLFTSGSSGRPKGVMISHRAIVNHLLWMTQDLPLHTGDRIMQRTPFSFDASVSDFYPPLAAGACLVVAPAAALQDSAVLAARTAEQRATVLHVVPTLLRMLVDEPVFEHCSALRRILSGGEALPGDLVRRLYKRGFAGELYNLYGPTEATIHTTWWRCPPTAAEAGVPIGRPIDNVGVYVLDRAGAPVPAGVAGELHIRGLNLARGYLGQPRQTAERFVPDPFCRQPGQRMYRSGDRARVRSDGVVEFRGRL